MGVSNRQNNDFLHGIPHFAISIEVGFKKYQIMQKEKIILIKDEIFCVKKNVSTY